MSRIIEIIKKCFSNESLDSLELIIIMLFIVTVLLLVCILQAHAAKAEAHAAFMKIKRLNGTSRSDDEVSKRKKE